MRPNLVDRNVVESGDLSTGMFGLSMNATDQAHILSILRDRLYTNKILAVLREYSTNAWDAHVEAGIPHTPIKVTLPTHLNPVLIIRDYGIGLAEEDIYAIYTQYGASTKRESNEVVGMLGIGAKSAFSYSDSFTVTSSHKGMKKVYIAVLDSSNMGKMTKMFESPSEETGVEVNIPANPNDEHLFAKEARTLFPFFWPNPIINTRLIDLGKLALETPVGFLLSEPVEALSKWTARMGCVPYRLDFRGFDFTEHDALIQFTNKLSGCLYFKLGEVDVGASREELEYTDKTKQAVIARLYEVREAQSESMRSFVEHSPPGLERRLATTKLQNTLGIPLPPDLAFLAHRKVKLYDFVTNDGNVIDPTFRKNEDWVEGEGTYVKTPKLRETLKEVEKAELGDTIRTVQTFTAKKALRDRTGSGAKTVEILERNEVSVVQGMEFFYNDEPDRRKIKHYERIVHSEHHTLIDPVDGATYEEVETELEPLLKKLELTGVPFRKLTELPYFQPAARKGFYSPQYRATIFTWKNRREENSGSWEIENSEMPVNGVYVLLHSFRSDYPLADILREKEFFSYLMPFEEFPTIYGVKSTEKNPLTHGEIRGIPYSVWRKEKARELVETSPDVAETLQAWRNYQELKSVVDKTIIQKFERRLGKDHELVQLVKSVNYVHETIMARTPDTAIDHQLGKVREAWNHLDKLLDKPAVSTIERLTQRYPLITSLPGALGYDSNYSTSKADHWARYIQLIDKHGAS